MKIRLGFVSNSSSSSFIVLVKAGEPVSKHEEDFIASEEDIKKLVEYGFTETGTTNPFRYEELRSVGCPDPIVRSEELALVYSVHCNQDEVIYFLVKNNIPFRASVHYQNHYYCCGKDWSYLLRAENFGQTMCMYGEERTEELGEWKLDPVQKIPKDEYLKDEQELWGYEENED